MNKKETFKIINTKLYVYNDNDIHWCFNKNELDEIIDTFKNPHNDKIIPIYLIRNVIKLK